MSNTSTAPAAPSVASVYLNGVPIGSLPIAQHRQLLAEAKRDRWLYLGQLCNWLWVIFTVLAKAIAFVPAVLTLLLFLLALFASSLDLGGALLDMASKVASASPRDIGEAIKFYFAVLLGFSGLVMVIAFAWSDARNFGYRNLFEERVNFQLRKLLEAPAEGDIFVTYWPAHMVEDLPRAQS